MADTFETGSVGGGAGGDTESVGGGSATTGGVTITPCGHVVAMVCDFFYPRLGGVEMHIWSLSHALQLRGCKVIVVTHHYGKRRGIRYMTNGLKVYYLPITPFVDGASFPTFTSMFPLFRQILIRERVTIVHGHQATSTLMHECILQARTMGYKCVYTDHSLFGFADAASINLNKVMKFTLSDVDHAIAVSHTCRENLVLRASLDPYKVSAIPNAVDPRNFVPDPSARLGTESDTQAVNIVLLSRLVYRKGVDLAVDVIPEICRRFPRVKFIIGGDGPKRLALEEMREKHQLHERIELLGAVPHNRVRDVLVRGHIYLNCSLTEAFCIAIVEAASCGLFVVSTRVGGVPEVLPPEMIRFAEPTASAVTDALATAILQLKHVDPAAMHARVVEMYSWRDVAARTLVVYDNVAAMPNPPLLERLQRYFGAGLFFGWICCGIAVLLFLLWRVLEVVHPRSEIEIAPEYPLPGLLRSKLADTAVVEEDANFVEFLSARRRAEREHKAQQEALRAQRKEKHD